MRCLSLVSYEHLDLVPGLKALGQGTTIMLSKAGSFYNHWGLVVLPDDVKVKILELRDPRRKLVDYDGYYILQILVKT